MAKRKVCRCVYEVKGHKEGQEDCPYGQARVQHPDGVTRRVGGKGVTLRNMASVTIKRLPGGAVAVTGRKLAGAGRVNPFPVGGPYPGQRKVGVYVVEGGERRGITGLKNARAFARLMARSTGKSVAVRSLDGKVVYTAR